MSERNQNEDAWEDKHLITEFAVTDPDSGQPLDGLDAGAAIWILSWGPKSAALITKTSALAELTFVDVDGTKDGIRRELVPADWTDLAPGRYYQELEYTDGAGKSWPVMTGEIHLHPATIV